MVSPKNKREPLKPSLIAGRILRFVDHHLPPFIEADRFCSLQLYTLFVNFIFFLMLNFSANQPKNLKSKNR